MTYTGAGSRIVPARGLALSPTRWAYQPKLDGAYATATTDIAGRIVSVVSRSGRAFSEAADLLGIVAGPPLATLHGELEAHTEAGIRAAACRGWAALHLFDCTASEGHSIAHAPYSARWSELHRAQTAIEQTAAGRIAPTQPDPRTFTWAMPGPAPARTCWCMRRRCSCCMRRCKRLCCNAPSPRTRPYAPKGATVPGGPPRDLRRFPIVDLHRGKGAGQRLWDDFVGKGGEGVVAVRLDAPAGVRNAKRKIKDTDTLDCRVIAVDSSAAILSYGGHMFAVSAQSRIGRTLTPGVAVAVAHDGWYESGARPRFARIVRVRDDLAAPSP